MLFVHCERRAASRAAWTAGRSNAISTAMMAITTSSSIRVNPRLHGILHGTLPPGRVRDDDEDERFRARAKGGRAEGRTGARFDRGTTTRSGNRFPVRLGSLTETSQPEGSGRPGRSGGPSRLASPRGAYFFAACRLSLLAASSQSSSMLFVACLTSAGCSVGAVFGFDAVVAGHRHDGQEADDRQRRDQTTEGHGGAGLYIARGSEGRHGRSERGSDPAP